MAWGKTVRVAPWVGRLRHVANQTGACNVRGSVHSRTYYDSCALMPVPATCSRPRSGCP